MSRQAQARRNFLKPFRITDGDGFSLQDHETDITGDLDKPRARRLLATRRKHLANLQENLYAQGTHGIVVVLQGMDTSGKDGVISHVFGGLHPQGVIVNAFKQPGRHELAHDFLWRIHQRVPTRGTIGIFNRSHYEDVLILRVHPDRVRAADVRGNPRKDGFWHDRMADIRHFESYLSRQNITTLKFMLHISAQTQRDRLIARLEDPQKRWKYDPSDLSERGFWGDYQHAFQSAITHTAQEHAPWYVVPSDHKWFARLVVVEALIEHLEQLDPKPPAPDPHVMSGLDEALATLRA